MGRQIHDLWAIVVCTVSLAVCPVAVAQEQGRDAEIRGAGGEERAVGREIVSNEEMAKVLEKIEHVLQRVQRRTAADGTLAPLADTTIEQGRYPSANGGWIGISAPTQEQIDIPTTDGAVTVPGLINVGFQYVEETPDWVVRCGLFNGFVTWKTNDPHVFATLGWLTRDRDAPDRLLTIVREELQRADMRLAPMHKLDWPFATPAERLSQFLPPEPLLTGIVPNTPQKNGKTISQKEIVFSSPAEAVTAYRQAYARKDWAACFLCLTPAGRGAVIKEFLFVAGMGNSPRLAKAIEKGLKLNLFDDAEPESKEVQAFLGPLAKEPDTSNEETENALLYEAFRKRIDDMPGFLAGLCQDTQLFIDYGDISSIRIEGDKASGYFTHTPPAPTPTDVAKGFPPSSGYYLPQYYPWHFRKLGGSWLFADAPLHQ